jgi:putative transposase
MIRTRIIPCRLPKQEADALNLESGRLYTQVMVTHWRVVRKQGFWLGPWQAGKLNDYYNPVKRLHAHSIDAAQQGFYQACQTARACRQIGRDTKYPHGRKKFRTTIWKNTAIKHQGNLLELSNGRGNPKIQIVLPEDLRDSLRVLEVRLVYDKQAGGYNWHIVVENGKQPKPAPGSNIVSVDLGEIHPAVVGDEKEATIITGRERRALQPGHAKRSAALQHALSRKQKGSRRYKKLVRARTRMKAKHRRVMRDMEHKISRVVVDVAVESQAGILVIGDVRDVADEVDLGKRMNQKISQWNHGKIRSYIEYKAEAEGLQVKLVDESYSSQTCPNCGQRHKPRGRNFKCPSCGFRSHRDVVGQVNLLSRFKVGEVGKLLAPTQIKYRIPHNLRVMRGRRDTDQGVSPVARSFLEREAAGL